MDIHHLFSSYYLAPISYYYQLLQHPIGYQDIYEHFVKQTYRNRCYILSPNGIQSLTIPIVNVKKLKPIKDVKIAYDENWQKIHWKSFEAAYRKSPYFEFYEDEFYPFYQENKTAFLIDFNEQLEQKIIKLLALTTYLKKTTEYIDAQLVENDYRTSLSPKKPIPLLFKNYIQVFGDRNEFAPNLSIIDLLFNEGPNSINYLNLIEKME